MFAPRPSESPGHSFCKSSARFRLRIDKYVVRPWLWMLPAIRVGCCCLIWMRLEIWKLWHDIHSFYASSFPFSFNAQQIHLSQDVDNLKDFIDENLVKTDSADAYLTLVEIKNKMSVADKKRFPRNDHLIKRLEPYLGRMFIDSDIVVNGEVKRVKQFWRGWRLRNTLLDG